MRHARALRMVAGLLVALVTSVLIAWLLGTAFGALGGWLWPEPVSDIPRQAWGFGLMVARTMLLLVTPALVIVGLPLGIVARRTGKTELRHHVLGGFVVGALYAALATTMLHTAVLALLVVPMFLAIGAAGAGAFWWVARPDLPPMTPSDEL